MGLQYNLTLSATQGNNWSILITHFYIHIFWYFLNLREWFFLSLDFAPVLSTLCPFHLSRTHESAASRLHAWTLNGKSPPCDHKSCGCSQLHPSHQEGGSLTWQLPVADLFCAPASFSYLPHGPHSQNVNCIHTTIPEKSLFPLGPSPLNSSFSSLHSASWEEEQN